MPRLRFHWDFFGPDAEPTAVHFLKHLDTFCAREGVTGHAHWTAPRSAGYTATMECDEQYMILIRDALRPKRAERVLE
ncbi:MAG: hypothetical protein JNM62_06955 [Flavobacteriales bacterium]|nr:hypothetical protein [Flavobacteriales bacterium]